MSAMTPCNYLPFSLFVASLFLCFSLFIPRACSMDFRFSSFVMSDTITPIQLDKEASISTFKKISLMNQPDKISDFSIGQASYFKPVHLWSKETGNETDFTTQFYFKSKPGPPKARGRRVPHAFFLANFTKSTISNYTATTKGSDFIVAVEFNTWKNRWNPDGHHFCIDIKSIVSVSKVTSNTRINAGESICASVTYDSSSKLLSLCLTCDKIIVYNGVSPNLSYAIDLMKCLPKWVSTVGFSAATRCFTELHDIYFWNFNSSLHAGDSSSRPVKGKKNTGKVVKIWATCGATIVVAGLCLVWYFFIRRKKKENDVDDEDEDGVLDPSIDDEFDNDTGPRRFSYAELVRATNNFDEERKLGEGGFGGVYRGFLCDLNLDVAVKRISKGSKQGIKEYMSEVKIMSRLRHKNLVQLRGWCHQQRDLLLVYDFMPNGSLDSHLHGNRGSMTWELRYKIALDLSYALLYLHEEWEQCVIHRDVKSSNVILDSNFSAKLGDFGLARLVEHGKESQTTILAGTLGYMAPECVITGMASKESDVYSFGMVALEIACGRRPIEKNTDPDKVILVEWVRELYERGKILEAADPSQGIDFYKKQIERLLIVGLWCAHSDHNLRPTIWQAMLVLNFDAPLPILPSKTMPMPPYSSFPSNKSAVAITSFQGNSHTQASCINNRPISNENVVKVLLS